MKNEFLIESGFLNPNEHIKHTETICSLLNVNLTRDQEIYFHYVEKWLSDNEKILRDEVCRKNTYLLPKEFVFHRWFYNDYKSDRVGRSFLTAVVILKNLLFNEGSKKVFHLFDHNGDMGVKSVMIHIGNIWQNSKIIKKAEDLHPVVDWILQKRIMLKWNGGKIY
jgi:hypothetical protein